MTKIELHGEGHILVLKGEDGREVEIVCYSAEQAAQIAQRLAVELLQLREDRR